MAKALHYGLVGAAGIGGYHLTAIRELEKENALVLAAVADPALAGLTDLQVTLRKTGVSCYLDYREMLRQQPGLDVIVISAPIPYHLEMALACLERGVFVYLEKPPVPMEITAELYRARPIESYDLACLRRRFPSGVTFTAALTHATEVPFP